MENLRVAQNMARGFESVPSSSSHGLKSNAEGGEDQQVFPPSGAAELDGGSPADDAAETRQLRRSLTPVHGVAIIVGIIIGSGIFSSVGLTLERSGSVGGALLAWVCSGLLVILNSQVYAELGAMIPTTGGDYDYLLRAYGSQAAFSFAFFNFFISKTASQAIIASVFGRYCEAAFVTDAGVGGGAAAPGGGGETVVAKFAAVASIVALTALNCAGIRESAAVQQLLTALKLCLVVVLFATAVAYATHHPENIVQNLSYHTAFLHTKGPAGFFSAMIACLWAFDGYADANFLQEEYHGEHTNMLPLVLVWSLAIVTAAYTLANLAYFAVLDVDVIESSKSVAVTMGEKVGGHALSSFFAVGVIFSTLGSNNGSIMTGGRAFYAVARGGHAPKWLAQLNYASAPANSLVAQGIWTIVLLLLPGSGFASLLDYFGPASWFFYALSSSALIVLRWKEPDLPRPFVCRFYPLPPLLVILTATLIIVSSVMHEPLYCGYVWGGDGPFLVLLLFPCNASSFFPSFLLPQFGVWLHRIVCPGTLRHGTWGTFPKAS